MSLGAEVGLGPGHIMLDGDPTPPLRKRDTAAPTFRPMSIMAKRSPISATAEVLCKVDTHGVFDHATYRSRQTRAKTLRHLGRDSSALGARQFGT